MRLRALVIAIVCACGSSDRPPEPAPGSSAPPPKPQAPSPPPDAAVAPVAPARSLLGAIPADTPFVFVTLDPIPAPLWHRLGAELDGEALRASANGAIALSPIRKLRNAALAELGAALASKAGVRSLGIAPTARFAIYGVGLVPVVRIELADPAATQAAIERVLAAAGIASARRGPAWIVDIGSQSVMIAITEGQLVIARTKPGADVAPLIGAATTPLDEATLRTVATEHAFTTGVGWIDPARLAASPELDRLAAPCRALVDAMFAKLPRVTLGFSELAATKLALSASLELDPATLKLLADVTGSAPVLPDQLEGTPLVAASWATPSYDSKVLAPWRAVTAACSDTKEALDLSPPWNQLRAGALVLYDVTFDGFIPRQIDAFAALLGPDPAALVAALRKHAPTLAAPTAGGGFVPLSFENMPVLGLARRDKLLVIAGGAGKARSSTLVMREAPLLRLRLDVAAIRKRLAPDPGPPKDHEIYRVPDGVADTTFGDLANAIGVFEFVASSDAKAIRLTFATSLAPPTPKRPPVPTDPRYAIRDRCVAILRKALTATQPALAKLGITGELDDIATTYMTSVQTHSMLETCAKLTTAERDCVAKAANPIAVAETCAPRKDNFGGSALALPPLFSYFGPRPLEARMHPPIDGKAVLGKLAGTWVRKTSFATQTWVIDAAGNVTITSVDDEGKETKRQRLVLDRAGKLELHEGNGSSTKTFFMPSPDRFYTDGRAFAITSRDRFLADIGGGTLIREPAGCWVVTAEGLLVDATCKATGDTLEVAYSPPCNSRTHACEQTETLAFHPGFVVDEQLTRSQPFVRKP